MSQIMQSTKTSMYQMLFKTQSTIAFQNSPDICFEPFEFFF